MDDTKELAPIVGPPPKKHHRRPPNAGIGRPAGVPNHATRDIKQFGEEFLGSKEYRENVKKRMLEGKAPHVERYLLERTYGKPTEEVAAAVKVTFGWQD